MNGMSTVDDIEVLNLNQYLQLKLENFEFKGQSYLFWEYVRILKELKENNPNIKFLLENVKMLKKWENIISETLGVTPCLINSALLSAQSRKRLYWTNISENIQQPEDKGLLLKDIIETGTVDRDKSYCIDACYYKGGSLKQYLEKSRRQIVNLSSEPFHQSEKRLMVKEIKSDCIQTGIADLNGFDIIKRTYSIDGKSPTLGTVTSGNSEPKITTSETTWRKLTPLECERLQTFEDFYTEGVSNTRRYHALGNSWTVDVIVHIFSYLKSE